MRRYWIDNLRWVTVVLVLIYHVFYFFNNKGVFGGIGGFSPDPMDQPQDVVMYILYPWFMMLLFLVAGICSRYTLEVHTPKEFIRSRTLKLLVPSTIGLFVFHWMTGYFNTAVAREMLTSSLPAIARYLLYSVSGIGPLWFIQDLWLFSLLLVLVRKMDSKDRFWSWCGKSDYLVILLLGILVYLGSQAMIKEPRSGSADGLFNLYKPLAYFIPFLLGYFVFSHDGVQERVERMRVPLLAAALISGAALVVTGFGKDNTSAQFLGSWLNVLYAWLMILANMGCFKAWCDATGRFSSYMSRSSFGIYVVHYLVVASLGYMMKTYTALPPWSMYVILLTAVLLLSPAVYEILRRIPVVRWCVFGIKKKHEQEGCSMRASQSARQI